MAKEIIMPKFGFTQEESEILEWLRKEGDQVEKNDPIAVVSTDKLSMEVEAPEAGILAGIRYQAGDIVPVTKIIAFILQPGEEIPAVDEVQVEKTSTPKEQELVKVAAQTEGLKATPIAERMLKDAGIDPSEIAGSGSGGKITKTDVQQFLEQAKTVSGKVPATPAARRIAAEQSIDLKSVHGSGPDGRIQEADVVSSSRVKLPQKDIEFPKEDQVIPLRGMRRIIAENMTRSNQEAPQMTIQVDVDMSSALALRNSVEEKFTYTAFITKAVDWALRKNPKLNSTIRDENIVLLSEINIGVAVAMQEGLIVPVVRNAGGKGINQISDDIRDLAQRARDNKLKPAELEGGTFTISNLGMLGVDSFTAIVNPPQAAILAVGRIVEKFVPDELKRPTLKPMMSMTLSADHRIVDGAEAALFMADLKNCLEHPGIMSL